MDRNTWMYGSRTISEYWLGLDEFIKSANENKTKNREDSIWCPCRDCNNSIRFSNSETVRAHLVRRGFKEGYTHWIWHGENLPPSTSAVGGNVVRNDPTPSSGDKINLCNDDEDVIRDRLDEMIQDVHHELVDKPHALESLFGDSGKPLYPGCSNFSKLSAVFKLYNLKATHGWSDKSFTALLKLLGDMFPKDNELPVSTYEAKKMLCPMGLEIEKIHACPNDCILYRREYTDLQLCPKCGVSRYKRKNSGDDGIGKKCPPAKVLWYLPVIPRFKRLFANAKDAKNVRWHADCRKNDGKLRHPADSPQWRNIDRIYPHFGNEDRNLRLGLCTDGMNPHGDMSSRHSTWPVLLVIYNLPPWLCMKRKYIMLSLLISGPKQPGNDIDVYLAPLVEDLRLLWNEGVQVFDAYGQENFTLRAMLFCTINDFPANGNLSGYVNKGLKACPICGDETDARWLHNCKKTVYMGHRRFLPISHAYRRNKEAFNGETERRTQPQPLTGRDVYAQVQNVNVVLGKTTKPSKGSTWKKRSIFWELPYWEHLSVRHCIDVMHVEKNVCDSIIGTLLDIQGKTKDSIKVRKDMVEMGIRKELAPQEDERRIYLPAACYTLSKTEKKSLCECLKSIKVPSGYASNVAKLVSMKDLKLIGLKSHDCHVLMQQLLPIAIRAILPTQVRHVLTKLCLFFNTICAKVIDPESLDELQADVVMTLCQLEMYFPPSFFDIMVHLIVHLVREIKACGLVFLRYMYPFERYMCILKGYVRNRYRPEGSIIEGYAAEEAMEFCTGYLDGVQSIGVPRSRHEGRLVGKGTIGFRSILPDAEALDKAHFVVLQHVVDVAPYLDEHISTIRQLNPTKGEVWIVKQHNRTFVRWFKNIVMEKISHVSHTVPEMVQWLAYGPAAVVHSYEGYDINGYTFYTKRQDDKSTMQNSGVTLIALSRDDNAMPYYGVIEEIWELEYRRLKFPLFRCKWVENRSGLKKDDLGYTLVDLNRSGYIDEPFILASKATQVFYVTDPANPRWSVVISGKRRIVGVGDVVDEEEYDHFDETPSCSTGVQSSSLGDDFHRTPYTRPDHVEGICIDHRS